MRFLCCVVVVVVSEWSIDLNWVVGLKLPWCLHGTNPPFNGEGSFVRILYVRSNVVSCVCTIHLFRVYVPYIRVISSVRPSSVPENTCFQARTTDGRNNPDVWYIHTKQRSNVRTVQYVQTVRFWDETLDVLLMDESPNAIAWHFFSGAHTIHSASLLESNTITNEHSMSPM